MMRFAFDLISDLHVDTWGDFSWEGKPTSTVCVVAGDIGPDHDTACRVLQHLGKCYQAVFYIDGNDEHSQNLEDLDGSYKSLIKRVNRIPNIVYLQDNVVVIEGVAILGTNGWWNFDFDLNIDPDQAAMWFQDRYKISTNAVLQYSRMGGIDATYMTSSVKRLQTHSDVKKIVMVTHTVPDPALISHDIGLADNVRMNTMGNRYMMQAMASDTENKIHTWCFGHYHGSIDQVRSGIRFVNNCRGRAGTPYSQHAYQPKRIEIDF